MQMVAVYLTTRERTIGMAKVVRMMGSHIVRLVLVALLQRILRTGPIMVLYFLYLMSRVATLRADAL